MSGKHTPGPWGLAGRFQRDLSTLRSVMSGEDLDGLRIALTYDETETDRANARLISAAPELLSALQTTVAAHDTFIAGELPSEQGLDDFDVWLAKARAAIAKATRP